MRKTLISCLTVLALAALCGPGSLTADTIERGVVAGGGGVTAGDGQTLSATIGQPLTGHTAGSHILSAGFWHPPAGEQTPIFLADFSAARNDGRVLVSWHVNVLADHLGMHVWRQAADGERQRLSEEPLSGAGPFEFTDPVAPPGELEYWLEAVPTSGESTWFGPVVLASVPLVFELAQNHPNPFNPKTTLRFSVRRGGQVRLTIHDLRGRLVRTLIEGVQPAGWHAVDWNGTDNRGRSVPTGVYFSRLQAFEGVKTGKLQLTR